MSFSFASIGHALASGLHDFYTGSKAVVSFIEKLDTPQNQQLVEGLTSLIPTVGPEAAIVERGVFAISGQVAAILTNVNSGGASALLSVGFDKDVIADFEALIKAVPGLITGKVATPPPVTTPPTAPAANVAPAVYAPKSNAEIAAGVTGTIVK